MPLLKRKAFEKSKESEYLRDDDEVFHCEITDEIFKDYEEYCERIILVNSMVWSCEMTGKNNLTYAEALESEKAARKSLKDFPMELRIPILYLAALTKRCSFAEMTEDVFNFVRERYFVGETVEAVLEGDSWVESHLLTVTAPKQEPGNKTILPASEYCYEVEQLDEDNNQSGTVSHDRIRRRKGIFSREKCRLFMKQFVEMMPGGIIGIKKQALEKYNISKVSFDQIFTGSPPVFPSSKKLVKLSLSPNKTPGKSPKPGAKGSAKKATPDSKQQSMDKFVKKTQKGDKQKNESNPNKQKMTPDQAKKMNQDLVDKMRRAEESMKQQKEEEKARENEKKARLKAYIKEWQKVKEDLLLEDHKVIPKATPIYVEGIPHEHFGDFLSVLEFIHLYSDTLKTKDVFHSGLDLETFRKALTQKEHAGVFSDIIQMMMTTLFSLQEDEAEEYNEGGRIADVTEDTDTNICGELGVTKAVEYATKACKWSQTYLGTPLSKLPLDPTTVSEVLRLHILSSGAEGGSRCATWRYQQRGGYSSIDDAGLHLRVARPSLVRRLRDHHVADLHLDDKLRVLQCLMNQILSYATVRDIIEEKIETCKNTKIELRALLIQERKREMEVVAQRTKLKKEAIAKKEEGKLKGEEAAAVDNQLAAQLEKLNKESDAKKAAFVKKQQQLQADCFQHLSYLGSDRAYRRYWIHAAIGGVLVESGGEDRGGCGGVVVPRGELGDTLAYVTQLFERGHEPGGSDKENDSASNSRGNSPKKPFTPLNGLATKLNGMDSKMQHMKELFVCTGDEDSCYVHGKVNRPEWSFYHKEEQIESLIESLNKRGVRESELRHVLEMDRINFIENVQKCPVHMLNPEVAPPPPIVGTRQRKYSPSLSVPADSTVSEALELSLRDYILELEEKIFHGCLGAISVKDREAWRGTLMLRGYDKQAEFLTWGPNKQYRDDHNHVNGDVNHTAHDRETPESKPQVPEYKYRDPGFYLGETGGSVENGLDTDPEVVIGLASALLQVEQGIHHKYIRRPLGLDEKERKERDGKGRPLDLDALERWEVSLMESKSYSQIFVHLFTLDSSVMWSASILNASCRICRRKTDPDNMLLCDTCNKGHHLYCLKPKLTKVPAGDWFCDQCKPKAPPTPRKRRKLFSDEEIEETLQESSDEDIHMGVCVTCGSGGVLAVMCLVCESRFHRECARPAPNRAARRWTCHSCLNPTKKHSVRRCAAEAMENIHQYANSLNETFAETSDSDDSEDNQALVKLKGKKVKLKLKMSRDSVDSPTINGDVETNGRRSRKSKEEQNTSTSSRKSKTPRAKIQIINGHHEESKSTNKRSSRNVEKLHVEALEELLRDVMKHKDCWPFYEPVNVEEVPDYLNIIETPMDFSTIRQKLSDRQYDTDQQVIRDATLVFTNCYVYNQETHLVAKAGVRLEKFFNKRCAELDLPKLPEIILENGEVVLQDEPKAKKAKLK